VALGADNLQNQMWIEHRWNLPLGYFKSNLLNPARYPESWVTAYRARQ
tara:strand:- start:4670 stop:4813 length:144 start_codon:yes stop_codon:yes gene_type:complete